MVRTEGRKKQAYEKLLGNKGQENRCGAYKERELCEIMKVVVKGAAYTDPTHTQQ